MVVEDDEQVADVVVFILKKNGYDVSTAADGKAGFDLFIQRTPDLVVLDINLPLLDGRELFRLMRQERARVPVIMLTSQSDDTDRIVGLEMGADDYVTKPFNARELAARVRAVLRRCNGAPVNKKVWQEGPLFLDDAARRFSYHGKTIDLTRQEFELIKALVSAPARTYSRDELINRMHDEAPPVTDRTVDACIKRIRKKLLQVKPDVDPVKTMYGIGYKLNENLTVGDDA